MSSTSAFLKLTPPCSTVLVIGWPVKTELSHQKVFKSTSKVVQKLSSNSDGEHHCKMMKILFCFVFFV